MNKPTNSGPIKAYSKGKNKITILVSRPKKKTCIWYAIEPCNVCTVSSNTNKKHMQSVSKRFSKNPVSSNFLLFQPFEVFLKPFYLFPACSAISSHLKKELHFQAFLASSSHVQPFPKMSSHCQPFPAMSSHLLSFPGNCSHFKQISGNSCNFSHFQQFPPISSHFLPFPAISSPFKQFPTLSSHFQLFQALSGNFQQILAFSSYCKLFPAYPIPFQHIPGYSRAFSSLVQPILAYFNL